ncbi:hypothetical protein HDV00_003058 [Rhizophlyctis rosea]|nr:hypothetical protein HDV00_003058 [Rhizophlyctis rosea]
MIRQSTSTTGSSEDYSYITSLHLDSPIASFVPFDVERKSVVRDVERKSAVRASPRSSIFKTPRGSVFGTLRQRLSSTVSGLLKGRESVVGQKGMDMSIEKSAASTIASKSSLSLRPKPSTRTSVKTLFSHPSNPSLHTSTSTTSLKPTSTIHESPSTQTITPSTTSTLTRPAGPTRTTPPKSLPSTKSLASLSTFLHHSKSLDFDSLLPFKPSSISAFLSSHLPLSPPPSTPLTSPTPVPKALLDLYRDVQSWSTTALPNEVKAFNLQDVTDEGEELAFMFHMTLNPNMTYGYEVVYACKAGMMVVRRLEGTVMCFLPEMRVVGRDRVLD